MSESAKSYHLQCCCTGTVRRLDYDILVLCYHTSTQYRYGRYHKQQYEYRRTDTGTVVVL